MENPVIRDTLESLAKKEEYARWFERGQDARRKKLTPNQTCLPNMRPGSNAYEAFSDGYTTPIKK